MRFNLESLPIRLNHLAYTMIKTSCFLAAAALLHSAPALAAPAAKPLTDWPMVKSAIGPDAKLEAQVAQIVSSMTLAQKIGQMTQPEIKTVSPAQVRD